VACPKRALKQENIMAFDPNLPRNNSAVSSAELRGQFTSLKALIDAVPAGPQGPPGPAGPAGIHVVAVSDNGDGRAIIEMSDGSTYGPYAIASGPQGPPGADSTVPGPEGPQGPAGNDGRGIANVRDSGDGTGRCFIDMTDGQTYGPFTIATGPAGMNGNDGRGISNIRDNGDGTLTVDYTDGNTAGPFTMPAGPQGEQGPAGEVSEAQLNYAIGGTANNPSIIGPFGGSFSDPPTQAEMQSFAAYVESLRQALVR
jgi:hypothetical protein